MWVDSFILINFIYLFVRINCGDNTVGLGKLEEEMLKADFREREISIPAQ